MARETSISVHFARLPDPRIERCKEHRLVDILTIALCAVLCGADDFVAIELFGREKEAWLRTFLDLPAGIPSHDTFGRVFALLDAVAFGECFLNWVRAVAPQTTGQVALDGKTLRGSHDRVHGKAALHLVSAWAADSGLVLGQVAVDSKSNEITAIPELLRLLNLEGCTVTMDAMGCQTAIAAQIVAQGADYILALKGNQGTLYEEVKASFALARAEAAPMRPKQADVARTVEKNHGRIEKRQVSTICDPAILAHLNPDGAWPKLSALVMVEAERRSDKQVEREARYYLSSRAADAVTLGRLIRDHWQIENRLHWVLDVCFNEDHQRAREGHSAQNMATLRHLALNLLRQDSTKASIPSKRFKAALNDRYLTRLLAYS